MRRDAVGVLLALAAALAGTGCVSTSISEDTTRIGELAAVRADLPRLADEAADPALPDGAREILGEPLDADAAVRVALLSNRELRAELRAMGIARGALVQAGALPNPTLELEIQPEQNSELELRVEIDVTDAILAPLRARAAEPALDAARYRAAARVVELGYRARTAFYGAQAAEERLRVAQAWLDALAASRDAAVALEAAGNLRALDSATEIASYERGRLAVAALELEVALARERVNRLLGLHGRDTAWRVASPLSTVIGTAREDAGGDVEARALRASLELHEARARIEALARRAGLNETEGWLPDVAVDVHALYNTDAGATPGGERGFRFGGGVSVVPPLFDRRQGATAAVEAELEAEVERYYGAAIAVRSAAREAVARVRSLELRARHYRDTVLPAQSRVTAEALLQYNAMQISVFDLLRARREELDVRLAYVDVTKELAGALAALDALFAGHHVDMEDSASAGVPSAGSSTAGGH
jgi:outer membrane protein TolC